MATSDSDESEPQRAAGDATPDTATPDKPSRPDAGRLTDNAHSSNGAGWVPGLIARQPAAFDGAFLEFQRRVFAYVVRMTKQRELAEDIVQETFVRLAHHAARLRVDTNLRAWLFTVAHRLVISHLRAANVRQAMTSDLMSGELLAHAHAATPFSSPMEAVSESRTQVAIERAISALPVNYREVVVLVAIEQVSITETAQILGVSNDAVRQRLSRARRILAAQLQVFDATDESTNTGSGPVPGQRTPR
ncbi:MAG: RNA polymerase sigma factor [Kofleriaceae bacterium]|nr:RNA polymerase sigma factor [Kofleriaceae bacterium]